MDGVTIVHRIIEVNDKLDSQKYQTKGDANDSADNWKVSDQDLVGKVVLRIRWLGLFTKFIMYFTSFILSVKYSSSTIVPNLKGFSILRLFSLRLFS